MSIRKRLASAFAKIACRLNPEICGSSEDEFSSRMKAFTHRKLGLTFVVTNQDALKYSKSRNISLVKADGILIADAKERIKRSIDVALENKKLYHFNVKSIK